MTAPAPKPFTVLFVDDDRAFLDTAPRVLANLSGGTWETVTASDAASAQVILQSQPVDLVILDAAMHETGDPPLMRLLRERHPKIPKVLLAEAVEESERTAGLEHGAALFLERPADDPGLERVYAALSELLGRRENGDSSSPPRTPILQQVKQACSAKSSHLFEVYNEEIRGRIYIESGNIVHAESPGRRGQSAFTYLTTLLDADYTLQPIDQVPERSIVRQWEFLYLEAIQLREQLAQAAEDAQAKARPETDSPTSEPRAEAKPAAKKSGPTASTTEPVSREPTEPEVAPRSPGGTGFRVTDEEATRALFRRPGAPTSEEAPPPVPTPKARATSPTTTRPARPVSGPPEGPPQQLRMLRPEVPGASGPTAPSAPKQADHAPVRGPRIQELLVCSYSAEVLYEWQCPHADKRLKFVEVARDRSERLTAHLPLGPVDRLELQAAQARFVVRFQEDGAVLLRSATGEKPATQRSAPLPASTADWLADQTSIRGLLAAAVLRPPQPPVDQPVDPEFAREALSVAWQGLQELLDALPEQGVDPWQLRWIFERAQLYRVRREDGRSLAVFLTKDPSAVDTEAVERMFRDFKTLGAD